MRRCLALSSLFALTILSTIELGKAPRLPEQHSARNTIETVGREQGLKANERP